MTFARRIAFVLRLICVVAVALGGASIARAQDGATLVAIVAAEPTAPLVRRVRAELEGLGVDVIVLKPPAETTPSRTPLDQAARGVGAIAAVRIVPSGAGVEVWVADRATGKAVVRELVAPSNGGSSDAFIAVGVVELLRASLMELHAPDAPHGDAPVTPRTLALALPAAPPPPEPPRLALSAGGGIELGVRGLGPSADATLALWARATDRFGGRAFVATTLAPERSTVPEGSIEITSQRFGLEGTFDLASPRATWVPSVGLGVLGAHLTATGTASGGFASHQASAWAAGPLARVGLGFTVVQGLRLRADALGAWTFPTPHIRVLGGDIGQWGAPLVSLSLSGEILWAPSTH